jgi:hypothetical protein
MEWLDSIVFSERDKARRTIGTEIEREDKRTREIGRIERAGSMGEMMVELGKTAPGKKVAKAGKHRFVLGIFAAILI